MDMLVQQCIVSKQVTNSYFGWHTKLFFDILHLIIIGVNYSLSILQQWLCLVHQEITATTL